MEMVRVKIRKEVVQCLACKKPKDFLFLSDFSYGERLIYSDDGLPCAFCRLIDDKVYDEYGELVRQVLKDNLKEISEDKILDLIIETFGVTCDEINGNKIDFSKKQKKECLFCGANTFSRNIIEPESYIEIELPLVSHEKWLNMEFKEKYELVKREVLKE